MKEGKLNLEYYCGQDLYSDGDIENQLLELVRNSNDIQSDLQNINSWPFLYHLSNIRENILEWYDFNKEGILLEIGSGCGALTGLFCEKVKHVVGIDLSKRRSQINEAKNKQYDNFEIYVGNFEDIKLEQKFDYVTLIGVLEYSIYYLKDEEPFLAMLKKAKDLLLPGGKLIIAIENKYGLKYWNGATEDHTGNLFDSLQDYTSVERVRTFSRKTLEKLIKSAGYDQMDFYYPMPDYKMPLEIFSEQNLPKPGDLRNNCTSFDRERFEFFSEDLVFDSICSDDLFTEYANSFLVICNKSL